MREKHWNVDIYIDEYDEKTRAHARLRNPNDTGLAGVGTARLNPADVNVPEIGDELAVSRALAELAHRLLDAAAGDIENITHERTHLYG